METAFMRSAPLAKFRAGGHAAARTAGPRSGRRRGAGRVGPRGQSVVEDADESVRDLRGAHRLVLAIPMSNPVERPGQREGGHFRIMRVDRAVAGSLVEQAADTVIDLRLELLDAPHRF